VLRSVLHTRTRVCVAALIVAGALTTGGGSVANADTGLTPALPGSAATLPASIQGSPVAASTLGVVIPPRPPAGTDLTRLSSSELDHYGLPQPPPLGSPQYSAWYKAMKSLKSFIDPQFATTNLSHGPAPTSPSVSPGTPSHAGGNGGGCTDDYLYSVNWAGYQNLSCQAGNRFFKQAQAEWTIPTAYTPPDQGNRYSSMWSGLGSGSGEQLLQTGIELATYWSGGVSYYNVYPWWQSYPGTPENKITNFSVHIHDDMFASVEDNGNGTFYYYLNDNTTGKGTGWILKSYGCNCTQAETILERDTVNGSLAKMTRIDPVNFVNDAAKYDTNQWNWMGDIPHQVISMWTSLPPGTGQDLVDTYPISGGNFTATRTQNQ